MQACPAPRALTVPRRTTRDPIAYAFGQAVKRVREDKGETLETVAGRIKRRGRDGNPTRMDAKYLLSLEGGWHSPTITTATQIAEALDVPLSDLVRDLGTGSAPRGVSGRASK